MTGALPKARIIVAGLGLYHTLYKITLCTKKLDIFIIVVWQSCKYVPYSASLTIYYWKESQHETAFIQNFSINWLDDFVVHYLYFQDQ